MARNWKRWTKYDAQVRGWFYGFLISLPLIQLVWSEHSPEGIFLRQGAFVLACGLVAGFAVQLRNWLRRRSPNYDPLADLRPR